jgi:hypothetical protein
MHLPQVEASFGDLEFGDADEDGDLDALLVDCRPGVLQRNDRPLSFWEIMALRQLASMASLR